MSVIVLLDARPLGMVTKPKSSPENVECKNWLAALVYKGTQVVIPEIADYEVRRELLRADKTRGLARLARCSQGHARLRADHHASDVEGRRVLGCRPQGSYARSLTATALAGKSEHRVTGLASQRVPLDAHLVGWYELPDPCFVLQLLQLRLEHFPCQPSLGICRRLLARRRVVGFVIQHGVGCCGIHHAPAHDQDARLRQLADVLRALIPVPRVLRLGHQDGVVVHGQLL